MPESGCPGASCIAIGSGQREEQAGQEEGTWPQMRGAWGINAQLQSCSGQSSPVCCKGRGSGQNWLLEGEEVTQTAEKGIAA